jgi:predicted MFS family arabinose efflux permease
LFLLIFYYSGIIGVLAMLKPYLVDLGYDVKQIGLMSGILGTSVAVVCSMISGYIIKIIGRKASFYLYAIFNIIAASFFVFLANQTPSLLELYIGICLVWGAYGLSTVIIYTSSMDKVRKHKEGTDFTVQIVVIHLSSLIVAVLSGRIGDKLGYSGLFSAEVVLGVISLLMVYINYPLFSKK